MPDVKLKDLSSRVLSLCLHRLNTDWEKHFGHPVLLVETFIDPTYHRGTCYKAANWIRLGETQEGLIMVLDKQRPGDTTVKYDDEVLLVIDAVTVDRLEGRTMDFDDSSEQLVFT